MRTDHHTQVNVYEYADGVAGWRETNNILQLRIPEVVRGGHGPPLAVKCRGGYKREGGNKPRRDPGFDVTWW